VLVGTISVEASETLSRLLKRQGIPHSVLNAKYHQQEAGIVSQAGRRGAVTIATNMAGRAPTSSSRSGVIRCNRACFADSRSTLQQGVWRNVQLCKEEVPAGSTSSAPSGTRAGASTASSAAGRAAGDPGSSRFFLSLEDD